MITAEDKRLIKSKKAKININEMMKKTDLTRATLMKFFDGEKSISLRNSFKICKELGLSIRFVEEDDSHDRWINVQLIEDMRHQFIKDLKNEDIRVVIMAQYGINILDRLQNG